LIDNQGRRSKKRVCIVSTTPFIVTSFLRPHIVELAAAYEVTVAINMQDGYPLQLTSTRAVHVVDLPIERRISIFWDVRALLQLWRLLAKGRFDAVHSFAPKAGLLAMVAGYIARVPLRIHTFQGEVWAARTGLQRWLLRGIDAFIARLATNIIVVGRGEQAFLEREGIVRPGKSVVLGDGSICGVDTARFKPDRSARVRVRAQLSVPQDAFVVLFLGRLTRDKGVLDLVRAFRDTSKHLPQPHLLLVGRDEDGLEAEVRTLTDSCTDRLHLLGYTETPERYLAAADVVCLPSYREGFATVILEAAACELPVIASRLYGTQEAIIDGQTGLFHSPGDVSEIERLLLLCARDPKSSEAMGRHGRTRVTTYFSQGRLVDEMRRFYEHLMGSSAT